MKKLKIESLKTGGGVLATAGLFYIMDKLGDLIISVLSADGMTWQKGILATVLLLLVFTVFTGLQSGWSIIKSLKRRLTGETRIEYLQKRISKTREDILSNLRNLKSTQRTFNSTVDSAGKSVSNLRQNDINFQDEKKQAVRQVLVLKDIYQNNISDLEKLVDQTYQDIDDAERLFAEAGDWSSNAADEFFK